MWNTYPMCCTIHVPKYQQIVKVSQSAVKRKQTFGGTNTQNNIFTPKATRSFEQHLLVPDIPQLAYRSSTNNMPKLRLVLVEAKDLIAADLGGTSDPFVILKTSLSKVQNKKVDKQLSPVWNETYTLEVSGLNDSLKIEVWDWDRFSSNDPIGDVTIPMKGLHIQKEEEKWLKLDHVKHGEIHIKLYPIDFGDELRTHPVIGVPLSEIAKREKRPSNIPYMIEKVLQALESESALREVGILRLAGSTEEITHIIRSFERGEDLDLKKYDCNSIADVLKRFMRGLPEPLFPSKLTSEILKVHEQYKEDPDQIKSHIKPLLLSLPPPNLALFRALTKYLAKVDENSGKNKMSSMNILTVLATLDFVNAMPATISYVINYNDYFFNE